MRLVKITCALLLLTTPGLGLADDAKPSGSAVESLHVDSRALMAAGAVRPVNGITSSGQPDASALRIFADSGYAAVIDLRAANENRGLDEADVVEKLGMSYVNFPIAGAKAINFDNAGRLQQLINGQDGPVLIHCGSGNRVGALLALVASLDGADNEQAILAGREGGLTSLEPVVRQRLAESNGQD
jgi:uncharacterized protein (TIGR01244 family)